MNCNRDTAVPVRQSGHQNASPVGTSRHGLTSFRKQLVHTL